MWYGGAEYTDTANADLALLFTLSYDQSTRTMTISALPLAVYDAVYTFTWRSYLTLHPTVEAYQDFYVHILPCEVTSVVPPLTLLDPKVAVIETRDFVRFDNFTQSPDCGVEL